MKVIIFGDSITFGKRDPMGGRAQQIRQRIDQDYNLENKKQNVQVHVLGIPGDLLITLQNRYQIELENRVQDPTEECIILFAIGVNDVNRNNWLTKKQTTIDTFKNTYTDIISYCQKNRNCKIGLISLLPVVPGVFSGLDNDLISEYNKLLKNIAQITDAEYIDIYTPCIQDHNFIQEMKDGIHPEKYGHHKIYGIINNFLSTQRNL